MNGYIKIEVFIRAEDLARACKESGFLVGASPGGQDAHPDERLVAAWLDAPEQACRPRFTLPEIMTGALKLDPAHMKPPEQMRVGAIMTKLGWVRKRFRDGNSLKYGYFQARGLDNAC